MGNNLEDKVILVKEIVRSSLSISPEKPGATKTKFNQLILN